MPTRAVPGRCGVFIYNEVNLTFVDPPGNSGLPLAVHGLASFSRVDAWSSATIGHRLLGRHYRTCYSCYVRCLTCDVKIA